MSQQRRSYSLVLISDVSTELTNFDPEIPITTALVNFAIYLG